MWQAGSPLPPLSTHLFACQGSECWAVRSSQALLPRKTQRTLATSFALPHPQSLEGTSYEVLFPSVIILPPRQLTVVSVSHGRSRGVGEKPQTLWEQR